MNIYLYLPPHSAHPARSLQGLVFGILQMYWEHNRIRLNYIEITEKLFYCLITRGHPAQTLHPIFQDASTHLDKEANTNECQEVQPSQDNTSTSTNRSIQITSCAYEQTWNETNTRHKDANITPLFTTLSTCGTHIEQVTTPYSRPPNLYRKLTSSRLHKDTFREVSHTLSLLQQSQFWALKLFLQTHIHLLLFFNTPPPPPGDHALYSINLWKVLRPPR